jgi:hypothetical protein
MKDRFTNALMMFLIIMLSTVCAELYPATKTWDGGLSTDWSISSNWIGGLPSSTDDVLIPGSLIRYPNIAAGQNFIVRNVTLSSGANLTISEGSLTVTEKLAANGGTISQSGGISTVYDFELNSGGRFNQSGGELRVSNNFKCSSGNTFAATGGTISFTGAGNGASRFTGNIQFYNIIIDSGVDPDFDSQANSTIRVM